MGLESLNHWLETWEALWLFVLIGGEFVVSLYSAYILTVEYNYDKDWNERVQARKQRMSKPKEKPVEPYVKEMD